MKEKMYENLIDNEVDMVERLIPLGYSADLITYRIIKKREVGLFNKIKPAVDMIIRAREEENRNKDRKEVKL